MKNVDTRFLDRIDESRILELDEIRSIRERLIDIKAEISFKNIDASSQYYNGVTAAIDFMLGHVDYRTLIDPNSSETQIPVHESGFKNGDIVKIRHTIGYIVFDKGPMAMVPSPKHKGWYSPTEAALFCGRNFFTNEIQVTNHKFIVKTAVPNKDEILFMCPNPTKLEPVVIGKGFHAVVLRSSGVKSVNEIRESALASELPVKISINEMLRDRRIVTVEITGNEDKELEISNMENIVREVISSGNAGMLTIF